MSNRRQSTYNWNNKSSKSYGKGRDHVIRGELNKKKPTAPKAKQPKKTEKKKVNAPKNSGKHSDISSRRNLNKERGENVKHTVEHTVKQIAPKPKQKTIKHTDTPRYSAKRADTTARRQLNEQKATAHPYKTVSKAAKRVDNFLENNSYINKGALKNGVTPQNIAKTIIGTNTDFANDFFTGAAKIGEGVIDTGANILAGASKLLGFDDAYNGLTKFIQRDLVGDYNVADNIAQKMPGVKQIYTANSILNGDEYETASVLGEKSDSIVQSGGQFAGQIGLQSIGVPWQLTAATSSYASATEEAYKNGASWEDAQVYGAISGTAEVASEYLFGGLKYGGRTADEGLKKALSKKIKNNVARSFTKYGIDSVGEGFEEVLSQIGQNVGKKLTFESDKSWKDVLVSDKAMQEYVDSFVGGAVLPLVTNARRLGKSVATGRDYDSNLSAHEQAIVDKETAKRVNEAKKKKAVNTDIQNKIAASRDTLGEPNRNRIREIEKEVNKIYDDGKDYTNTELSKEELVKIEDKVIEDLGKGKFDIDTIEEYFEPEKVKRKNEIETDIKRNNATEETIEEYRKLKNEIAEAMRNNLKDDYMLQETYKQELLKGENFKADKTDKESDITKKLRESMEASGIDNTRDTHELYSMLDKYGNDTGTEVLVVNSQQLKEMGISGKNSNGDEAIVNGMHTTIDGKQRIIINRESGQALSVVAGHEITHGLEDTASYRALQNTVLEYAKTKGDYETLRSKFEHLYDGTTTDIDGEMTAELVGRYLFEDENFIKHISAEEPSLAKRIIEKVKKLLHMASAGSKEERELQRVKDLFEEAYRENSNKQSQKSKDKAQYHISDRFPEEIDAALNNEANNENQVKARDYTPKILVDNGVKNLPMLITQSHIRSIVYTKQEAKQLGLPIKPSINYHGLGKRKLIEVIDSMDNPVAIYKKDEDHFIIITEIADIDGNDVIVPIKVDGNGKYNDVYINENQIKSVYGKKNLDKYISRNEYEIIYKKRGTAFNAEVQYHNVGDSLVNSRISESNSKVNGKTQFSLETLPDGTEYVRTEKDRFIKEDGSPMSEREVFNSISGMVLQLKDGGKIKIAKALPGKEMYNELIRRYPKSTSGINDKPSLKNLNSDVNYNIEELLSNSTLEKSHVPDMNERHRKQGIASFDTRRANFYDGDNAYAIDFSIGRLRNGEKIAYAKKFYGFDEELTKKIQAYETASGLWDEPQSAISPVSHKLESVNTIPKNNVKVNKKRQFSLSERGTMVDSDGQDVNLQASNTGTHGTLMAIRNIGERELRGILELGGIPVPSIAVTDPAKVDHSNFGDISILFNKDTIDPSNKKNEVYDRDAWTSSYPGVEYQVDADKASDIHRRAREVGNITFFNPANLISQNLENLLNQNGGEKNLIEKYKRDVGMKNFYLAETASPVDMVIRKNVENLSDEDAKRFDYILKRMPEEIEESKTADKREWYKKYGNQFKEAQRDFWKTEDPQIEAESLDKLIPKSGFLSVSLAKRIQDYAENGSEKVIETEDAAATKEKINKLVKQDEYEKWLKELFGGVQKSAGIRKELDSFKANGDRRSFEELHTPYNLENLVKKMTEGDTKGATNSLFGANANYISAKLGKKFESIADIKEYENRIKADADSIVEPLRKELYDAIKDLSEYYKYNQGNAFRGTYEAISELAGKKLTEANLTNLLSKYGLDTDRIPRSKLQEVLTCLNNLKNIPTDYFEAKPQRAVGLDEIEAVVIPKDTDLSLKQELADKNINIVEYDNGIKGDRNAKITEFDDIKFSLSNNERTTKVLNQAAVKDYAAEVQSEYSTRYNPYEDIRHMYEYMQNRNGVLSAEDLQEVEEMASDIADDMLANVTEQTITEEAKEILKDIRSVKIALSEHQKNEVSSVYGGYGNYVKSLFGNVRISPRGLPLDIQWQEWAGRYTQLFDAEMPDADQPAALADVIDTLRNTYELVDLPSKTDIVVKLLSDFYDYPGMRYESGPATFADAESSVQRKFDGVKVIDEPSRTGDVIDEEIALVEDMIQDNLEKNNTVLVKGLERKLRDLRRERKRSLPTRGEIHKALVDDIKREYASKGMDFDAVLSKAKNKSTFASVDNTPQRFIEKTLGYKEGQVFNDMTMAKIGKHEASGIRWLNSITGSKGLLATLSEKYHIKPGTKESAAAQKYAEGRYVDEYGDYKEYGDNELAREFPRLVDQERIKGLAGDPAIRKFYDETHEKINESRVMFGYEPIPKRKNYYLHYMEPEGALAKFGFPFAPSKLKKNNLPTDINGMTADNKPGQPYFSSSKQRKGIRTTYDILGGVERYANAAKNQIYHIEDIQRLRAVRNYLADMFGQEHGLENLDTLEPAEQKKKIEEVYNGHLSNFAKFLNEEANVIAGKTPLLDRGLEGMLGRTAITFMKTLNSQVGSNMVGMNVSSSLTNMVSVVQTIAKSSKVDSIRAFSQMCTNAITKHDNLMEQSDFWVRRQGAEQFYKNPWQKAQDVAYTFMTITDNFATELIIRTKYNEFKRKGYDNPLKKADEWAAKLLADRSLGQMPQLYNSSTLGLITKFQLEVRNQLDSMWYDTINEARETYDSKIAQTAKITSTMVQLAVFQHLFGKAFESVAGYNPAFDIIEVLMTALGLGDDDDDKEPLDRIEEAFAELLDDLPYTSTLTGGRIPIASALPIKELIQGKDQYGQDKPRLKTLEETAPYWLMPSGYGQMKKSINGMKMFSSKNPVPGRYNKKGKLQYPVKDNIQTRIQAGIFGANANANAREYYDGEHKPLTDKQLKEYQELNIPIKKYWEYREGLAKAGTKQEDKIKYISELNFPIRKKAIMMNNLYNDKGEANKWNSTKPAIYSVLGDGYVDAVKRLNHTKADKDKDGKTISGSRKEKVIKYLNNSNFEYAERLIVFKSEGYKLSDDESMEIINYLNERDDVNYKMMKNILITLGYKVDKNGNVWWD